MNIRNAFPCREPKNPIWTGTIRGVRERKGVTNGQRWKLYTIVSDEGYEFATFSATYAEVARTAIRTNAEVEIWWESRPGGLNVINIEAAP